MTEWISVKDRLPENYVAVLVFDSVCRNIYKAWMNHDLGECFYEYFRYGNYNRMYRTMDRGQFFNGNWSGEPTHGTNTKVLAWTELPLPKHPEVTP